MKRSPEVAEALKIAEAVWRETKKEVLQALQERPLPKDWRSRNSQDQFQMLIQHINDAIAKMEMLDQGFVTKKKGEQYSSPSPWRKRIAEEIDNSSPSDIVGHRLLALISVTPSQEARMERIKIKQKGERDFPTPETFYLSLGEAFRWYLSAAFTDVGGARSKPVEASVPQDPGAGRTVLGRQEASLLRLLMSETTARYSIWRESKLSGGLNIAGRKDSRDNVTRVLLLRILSKLEKHISSDGLRQDIWKASYKDTNSTSNDAPLRFLEKLEDAARRPLRSYEAYEIPGSFRQTEERRKLLEDTVAWVQADVEDAPSMVGCIWRASTPTGLSNFAKAVEQEIENLNLEDNEIEILYIPLGHIPQPKQHSAPETTPQRGGAIEVLSVLRHHFQIPRNEHFIRRPIGAGDDFDRVMHSIRTGMVEASGPTLLIVDGIDFEERQSPSRLLDRFISGNTVLGIISRMMDPPLASFADRSEWDAYRRNRILLLSNAEMAPQGNRRRSVRGWRLPHGQPRGIHKQLPDPGDEVWGEILPTFPITDENREIVMRFREQSTNVDFEQWSDLHYFAVDNFLQSLRLCHSQSSEKAEKDEKVFCDLECATAELRIKLSDNGDDSNDESMSWIEEIHLKMIEAIPFELRLLRRILDLLSLMPEGIRVATLVRTILTMLNLGRMKEGAAARLLVSSADLKAFREATALRGDTDDRDDHAVIEEAITLARNQFSSLLTWGADKLPGYDNAPLGTETARTERMWARLALSSSSDHECGSVCFAFPEMRRIHKALFAYRDRIIEMEDLADPEDPYEDTRRRLDRFQTSCRILMREAVAQQSVTFRHDPFPSGQMLRPWRRQAAAIALGLSSLPLVRTIREGRQVISIGEDKHRLTRQGLASFDEIFVDDGVQFAKSRDLYSWLFFSAYHHRMERPPEMRLTRVYGVDGFKASIMEAFDRPWSLWQSAFQNTLIDLTDRAGSRLSLVNEEFSDAKATENVGNPARALRRARDARLMHSIGWYQSTSSKSNREAARLALTRAKNVLGMSNEVESDELGRRISVVKRHLDSCILEGTSVAETAREASKMLSGGLPLESDRFLEVLLGKEAYATLVRECQTGGAKVYRHLCGADVSTADLMDCSHGAMQILNELPSAETHVWGGYLRSAKGLSALADVLHRVAERQVLSGREVSSGGTAGWGSTWAPPDRPPFDIKADEVEELQWRPEFPETIKPEKSNLGDRAHRRLSIAFALHMIAERLRLMAFADAPGQGHFLASANPMRVFIELCLILEARRRLRTNLERLAIENFELGGAPQPQPNLRESLLECGDPPFLRIARYCSDTLARHLHPYPFDRGGMLILEALSLRRIVAEVPRIIELEGDPVMFGGDGHPMFDLRLREVALNSARQNIMQAEVLLKPLPPVSRRRFRLGLERANIHRELAFLHLGKSDHSAGLGRRNNSVEARSSIEQAQFFEDLAAIDMSYLDANVGGLVQQKTLWMPSLIRQKAAQSLLRKRVSEAKIA